jgi:hypothetical protein
MRARATRRGMLALGAALVIAAAVVAVVAASAPSGRPSPGHPSRGHPLRGPFAWLVPRPAPAGWRHLALPNGTAVLSYPSALRSIEGDKDAVSVATRSPSGAYLLYLNATPRQGTENLRHWAAFRVRLLRAGDASSDHQDAAAAGLRFRGGTGSCVIDDYVTRIRAHHYEEIACLVQGRAGASVIVAAAPAARWSLARRLIEQAVAAYSVR